MHGVAILICVVAVTSGDPVEIDSAAETSPTSLAPSVVRDRFPAQDTVADLSISDEIFAHLWLGAREAIEELRASGFSADLVADVGPYWGEGLTVSRAHLWSTGDSHLVRSMLERVFYGPGSEVASGERAPLSSYSLLWPRLLLEDYRYSGNASYARTMAAFALPHLVDHFASAANKNGLLVSARLPRVPDALAGEVSPEDPAHTDATLNAFYYAMLSATVELRKALGPHIPNVESRAFALRRVYRETFLNTESGLFREAPGVDRYTVLGNAAALWAGLAEPVEQEAILGLIRREGAACAPAFQPYVIEAAFLGGAPQLGYDLLTFLEPGDALLSALYLFPRYVAGVAPGTAGWSEMTVAPRAPTQVYSFRLRLPLSRGRLSMHYARATGTRVLTAPGTQVTVDGVLGEPLMVKQVMSHGPARLMDGQRAALAALGWPERVGEDAAIWISVGEQMLRLIQGDRILYQGRSAAAENGVGSEMNSLKTPAGWHSIVKKVGDDAPWGQVFRARKATREIWRLGEDTTEDLVLSRILLLTGEEPGRNRGGNVDSLARNIYIHGTNDEARLGTPSSHGCIRLSNDDVIELYDIAPKGMLVLITEF